MKHVYQGSDGRPIVVLYSPELLKEINEVPDLGEVRLEADGTFGVVPKRLFPKKQGVQQFVTIIVPYNKQVTIYVLYL